MKIKFIATTLISSGLVLACGKSDPTASYQDLMKNSVPPTQAVQLPQQNLVANDFFAIDVDSDPAAPKELDFYEGQANEHHFTLRMANGGLNYKLAWTNAPAGASLALSPTQADVWILRWTLAPETLALNEGSRVFDINLQVLAPNGAAQATLDQFSKIAMTTLIKGHILHAKAAPVLNKVSGLDTPIKEGEQRDVTVDVTDLGSGQTPPKLFITQGTLDPRNHDANGAVYLEFNNKAATSPEIPSSLGAGKWRFHLLLDTKSRSVDHALAHKDASGAQSISLQVSFQIQSRSTNLSPDTPTHFTIVLNTPQASENEAKPKAPAAKKADAGSAVKNAPASTTNAKPVEAKKS